MPLSHLLMPQLAQKAQEIEDALGHTPVGYLGQGAQPVGYERTPYDPRGLSDKPEAKSYDPSTPLGRMETPAGPYLRAMGTMQRSKDPAQQAFASGMSWGLDPHPRPGGVVPVAPMPNPPETRSPDDVRLKTKPGKVLLKTKPDEAIGLDESGQSVDRKGKKLGYLNQPAIVTPYGDVAIRTSERRATDVFGDQRDPLAIDSLKQRFGKHLKEMRENVDARGRPTDQFPEGYFKNMTKAQRKSIEAGVKALRDVEREEEQGISI